MKPNVVHVENASVTLGGREILHDLNWNLAQGAHHFLLGANGAGKTTLVKMLMGFAWPRYGAVVEILGKRYGEVNLHDVRRQVAWVSPALQQWTNPEIKAVDMVMTGTDGTLGLFRTPAPEEIERAEGIMAQLDALKLRDQQISTLSSGEQVKILIARALMSKPALMVLDEPTVYLDIAGREFLLKTVERLAHSIPDLTILFITQRTEDILPVFQMGSILKQGRLVHTGKREEVLTDRNLSDIFGVRLTLHANRAGRLFAVVDE